jgi:hypothetical protein
LSRLFRSRRESGKLLKAGSVTRHSAPWTDFLRRRIVVRTNGHHAEAYPTNVIEWPASIGKAGYYGIAGEFVELVRPHTEADPNAILMAFQTYAGNLLGRNYFVPTGADRHCGNLNTCLVGPTSGGRKGSAISAAEQFFIQGPDAPGMPRVLYGISSGEGVIWAVHDSITKRQYNKQTKTFEDVVVEENIEDKRTLYCLSELQQSITNMRRPDSILSAVLRQAWDKDRISSPSKNSAATATGAHISMVAGISKEELLAETSTADAQNGTLNRFLFVCCQRARLLPEGDSFYQLTETREWGDLQRRFSRNIRNAAGAPLHIPRSVEAQKAWGLNQYPNDGNLYQKLSQLRPGLWGTVTARAPQQVIRLSLITSVINGYRTIETEHQDAGWEQWRYCDDSCKFIWGDTTDPTAGRILRGLRDSLQGLTRSEIRSELFFGHISKEDIDSAVAWLSLRGLAYTQMCSTGGRPLEKWFATL